MKEKVEKKQIWPNLRIEVFNDLKEIADKENRTEAQMAEILIENAIKERKRKRKNVKEE